jgi:TctA family transporter
MIPLFINELPWLGLSLVFLILPIIWFIIAIILCIWVYRDAEARGMGGALWLIIVLIAGIVGFIIYLVVRKPKSGTT